MIATNTDSFDFTEMLRRVGDGDVEARQEFWERIFAELRRLAIAQLRNERTDHTLQPSALVNELYIRLNGGAGVDWRNRGHFYATAARAMRYILVDHARNQDRVKRGGSWSRADLGDVLVYDPSQAWQIVAVDQCLQRLEEWDPRQCQIVEMRFFAGLTEAEVGEVLGLSDRTVKRDWLMAKAWLWEQLKA